MVWSKTLRVWSLTDWSPGFGVNFQGSINTPRVKITSLKVWSGELVRPLRGGELFSITDDWLVQ